MNGNIRSDERIVFFPTIARDASNETATLYEVPIHGWIFEPDRRDKRRRALLHLLGKAYNVSSNEKKDILSRRMSPFLVDNERWKTPRVKIVMHKDGHELHHVHRVSPSKKNGHFHDVVQLAPKDKCSDENMSSTQQLCCEAILRDADTRRFAGIVHLLADSGVSVISDIDDTIKVTNVTDTKTLIRNTFLKEFRAVPGMAELYSKWKEEHDASFHFVSSSPWQLYEEMEEFTQREGFPNATFHLKSVRPKDLTILNLFADPFKAKIASITNIVEQFPGRTFVLVGDSGEKDPEVYGQLSKTFPDQIHRVYIRDIGLENNLTARLEESFEGVPREKWTTFTDPSKVELSIDATETPKTVTS